MYYWTWQYTLYTLLWWYTSAFHGFPQKCTLLLIKLIKWGPVLLQNCGGGGGGDGGGGRVCVRACVRACHACAYVCVRACVCVCVSLLYEVLF